MIRAKVTGRIWSTRHIDSLPEGALLEVVAGTTTLVAYDPLGCAEGEEVLVTQGSVAAKYFIDKTDKAPVDALIIGSIDDN